MPGESGFSRSLIQPNLPKNKRCTSCGVEKKLDEYHRSPKGKYGRVERCKSCRKEHKAISYLKHRDKILERTSVYRKQEKNRLRNIEYQRNRRENNNEVVKQARRNSYARNRESIRLRRQTPEYKEKLRKYYESEQGQATRRRSWLARRARVLNAFVEDVPQEYIDSLLTRQNNYCRYCLVDFGLEPYTIEHIFPLSRGGKHEKKNIQLVCGNCNSSKLNKTHEEYLVYLNQISKKGV